MIAFLDAHREVYGVEPICRLLPIAPSTYYERAAHRADPAHLPARAQRDVRLRAEIRRVWEANFRVYGVRKIWRQLRREGIAIARCTTARLMKQMGLYGAIRGKTVKTTISNKAAPCPRDKVNRQLGFPPGSGGFANEPEHPRRRLWQKDEADVGSRRNLRRRRSSGCWMAVRGCRRWPPNSG
jgi:putative transposase